MVWTVRGVGSGVEVVEVVLPVVSVEVVRETLLWWTEVVAWDGIWNVNVWWLLNSRMLPYRERRSIDICGCHGVVSVVGLAKDLW